MPSSPTRRLRNSCFPPRRKSPATPRRRPSGPFYHHPRFARHRDSGKGTRRNLIREFVGVFDFVGVGGFADGECGYFGYEEDVDFFSEGEDEGRVEEESVGYFFGVSKWTVCDSIMQLCKSESERKIGND